MRKHKNMKNANEEKGKEQKYYCSVCGREIDEEEYENYDGMCWECWDDQLTEESEDMFGDVM
jgi:CRISPR/Cas system-associated protein Cas10 (large subunit of type III CRISPR-Cas system)